MSKPKETNPSHYADRGIEPIEFIRANRLDFLEGNVIKYVARHRYKDGLRDLLKAQQYLAWAIEEYGEGGAYTEEPEG